MKENTKNHKELKTIRGLLEGCFFNPPALYHCEDGQLFTTLPPFMAVC